jgi:hypothetical protein
MLFRKKGVENEYLKDNLIVRKNGDIKIFYCPEYYHQKISCFLWDYNNDRLYNKIVGYYDSYLYKLLKGGK